MSTATPDRSPGRPRVLLVTDLAYEAKGRRYGDEDVWLSARLRSDFDVALCHPGDAVALMDAFDVILVRNSGPVLGHLADHRAFRERAVATGALVFNELSGRADMLGKQYLVDLTLAGYPVTPTVDRRADVPRLPDADRYVVKPKLGADSIGLRIVDRTDLDRLDGLVDGEHLIQPHLELEYEVSFYVVGQAFHYALRTPGPDHRWDLVPYEPTAADLALVRSFVDWNDITHGIQRVDAGRTRSGDLLLVELEDLNPFLSLHLVEPEVREAFAADVIAALHDLASRTRRSG